MDLTPPPILIIAGGVALILFGVRYLRKGLDRLFGNTLGSWMKRLANRRIKAFFTGLGVSLMTPSSTTMSILAVNTVQAGHLSSRQMLAIMLGADIGLTMPVLLIALRVEQSAPVLILIGVLMFQFTRAVRTRGIGQVILGLGLIFMAIATIKSGAAAIEPEGDLRELLRIAQGHQFGLALIAAVIAIALQSSTATIGLVMGLIAMGMIQLPLALAVVAGANVGIGVTTLLVGWSQRQSRRLALGNLVAKITVAVLILLALPVVMWMLNALPGGAERQIAYAHAGFNILMAVIFLPLIGPLNRLTDRLVPAPPLGEPEKFGPRYINAGRIESLALATGQSMREIMRVAEIVRSMLNDLWRALRTNDQALAAAVSERDDQVVLLDNEIKRYLTRLSSLEGEQDDFGEQMRQLRYLNELETIGDVIDKNLSELVVKKVRQNIDFSTEGWGELDDFYHKVVENMLIAETAFATRDRMLAQQLIRHKEKLNDYERELRDRHFARLKAGLTQSHESSAVHLDILTHLKRINSSVTHVAYAILQDNTTQPGS